MLGAQHSVSFTLEQAMKAQMGSILFRYPRRWIGVGGRFTSGKETRYPLYTRTCKGRNLNYGCRSANNKAVSDMKSYAKHWMFVR